MFIVLYLFGNNKFVDGKKVEYAHQWGKFWQNVHNNFKLPFKQMVTQHAARMMSLIYIFNGGKWGNELQFQIGEGIKNLTDPDNPHKPHPIIEKVKIPTPCLNTPKIEVKTRYSAKYLTQEN